MAYTDQVAGSKRLSIIAGVALVHGALGYLFVSGMAMNFIKDKVDILTTTNIPIDPPPPTEPPPPQPPMAKTLPTPTIMTTIVPPIVETNAATSVVSVDPGPAVIEPPIILPLQPAVEPNPPAPSLASGPKVSGNRTAWFSNDDYPASAIRAGEEGTVGVRLGLGANGRVTSCKVTASSGSSALDLITCRLYQKRARFAPARDTVGGAIASSYNDRVIWRLPQQ
jgi:protein TonB